MNLTGKDCFKAGVSGNPGGRPKAVEEIRELARAMPAVCRATDHMLKISAK